MVKKPYVKYLLSVLILGGAMFAELYKGKKPNSLGRRTIGIHSLEKICFPQYCVKKPRNT